MDRKTRELFRPQIAEEAAAIFDVEITGEAQGFESFIFPAKRQDADCILRIAHTNRRSVELVEGEAEHVNNLHAKGISVPLFYSSVNGNVAELLSDGFICSVMEKAKGKRPSFDDYPDLAQRMGRFMAGYHEKGLNVLPGRGKRYTIAEDIYHNRLFFPDDPAILDKYDEIGGRILALPKDRTYQIIHRDFHMGNFFIDNGQITLFDWDDCIFSWHADDIGVSLYYLMPTQCMKGEAPEIAQKITERFVRAYLSIRPMDMDWLYELPLFVKYREMLLYGVILRSFGTDLPTERLRTFMENRRQRLLDDIETYPIDFHAIARLGS